MISGADVWVPHCQHLHHAWLLVLGSNARGHLSSLSRLSSSGTVGMQEAGHAPLVALLGSVTEVFYDTALHAYLQI
jgi:hypothetical protein